MFRGFGTVVNVVAVLLGSGIGVLVGHRLPQRTRDVVTDALGLVTLLVAALSAMTVTDPQLSAAVGDSAPVLIVLGSLLLGGIVGSLLGIEDRLEALGAALRRRLVGAAAAETGSSRAGDQQRFVEGFLTASLVFCVGPLTILGALSDGLGQGADQLVLKSVLDGFASIAFAASFGWGVAASALAVLAVQGSLTALGAVLGSFVPDAHLVAMTATGGVLLVGVALRLLQIRRIPVGDLLPALVLAPLLVQIVTSA
ncbi:MAG: DUF554 domain-containing protein [Actinomycetota bacterium]|nr:DUF554 domain-containing protein [Actinomycetota bacterium]